MDNKRHRDADNEASPATGKRARLDQAAALVGSDAMQAVAHEALAMSNGSSFSAINKFSSTQPDTAPAPDHRNNNSSTTNGRSSETGGAVSGAHLGRNGSGVSNANTSGTALSSRAPLKTMTDISRCFKDAVVTGWDRRSPTYSAVEVLLIYWEEDSSDVKDAAALLESVFRTSYHYTTDMFAIRSPYPGDELDVKVERFLTRNSTPDRLAILYYAGRCNPNPITNRAPIWAPRRSGTKTSLGSDRIEAAYEDSRSDVLLLIDHCDTDHNPLTKSSYGTARHNVVEVLSAPFSAEQGHINFTKTLADELAAAVHGDALQVETLHAKVASRMTIHKPRGRGRPPKEPPVKPPTEQQHLPKHYFSAASRSIVLVPLPNGPQVVLCIRVLNGALDVSRWCKWIYNAAPEARNTVQFEGLYSGFSTMVVLRVPAAEWDFFPECPAGSLVGYTTIGDITPHLLERIDKDLSAKLWVEDVSPRLLAPAPSGGSPTSADATAAHGPAAVDLSSIPISTMGAGIDSETLTTGADGDLNDSRLGPKKPRKALPTERKILPSGAMSPPSASRRREYARDHIDRPIYRPPQHHQQPQQHLSPQMLSRQLADGEFSDKNALLAAAAQKPFKISIKLAGQNHMCKECKAGFKDADALHNHVRKQHTRPFHCVFNWAGCESTFASKNEWKRHVMSQHILLHYWVCQVELCSKAVNKAPGAAHSGFSLPNGAIFNRKDLFTQHLRRMHTPPHVKKLLRQAKMATKAPSHPSIMDWENRLKELQTDGIKPRCRLPDYMVCPAQGCGVDFHGNNAWDDRMEHVARHLEGAAAGRETLVVFGGKTDITLTDWATRLEVGIAKRVGPNTWHLDNPLRPEIMEWTGNDEHEVETPREDQDKEQTLPQQEQLQPGVGQQDIKEAHEQHQTPSDERSSRERSKSVIEVADQERPPGGDTTDSDHGQNTEEDDATSPEIPSEEKRPSRESSSPGIVVSQ